MKMMFLVDGDNNINEGLITSNLEKSKADELIFGSNKYNYKNMHFGVVDLIPHKVESDSSKVKPTRQDVELLINRIIINEPIKVCIIHSKVMTALKSALHKHLDYDYCGKLIDNCKTDFYCNYFPNGNSIPTSKKIEIYKSIKNAL